ncbi:hypothetical protein [Streptosporangium sp. NPDC003464]
MEADITSTLYSGDSSAMAIRQGVVDAEVEVQDEHVQIGPAVQDAEIAAAEHHLEPAGAAQEVLQAVTDEIVIVDDRGLGHVPLPHEPA